LRSDGAYVVRNVGGKDARRQVAERSASGKAAAPMSALRPHNLSVFFGLLVLPFFAAVASASTVTLLIKNDDPSALRCMVVFAHWVTTDFGPIASGETATVAMTRGPQPGALHIARFDGRPMMIENIVCGTERDWSNSFDQLPLISIRNSATSTYQMGCRAEPRVACTQSREYTNENKETAD
jgi:hypothetical protein